MKKQNNAGLSLVELIVTILIICILSAGVTVAVSAMHRADAEKEARKIASILAKGRVQALSKEGENYVLLYADATGQYISWVNKSIKEIEGSPKTIEESEKVQLDAKVVIAYSSASNAEETTILTPGNSLRIEFSKSSGAFKSGAPLYIKVTADTDSYVCLVEDTGRCYIDTAYQE